MRTHLSNAAYSVLEYVAQPAGMLIAAPILLHRLELAPYGLWLIASAVAGTGSVVSSGFGDAIVQRVAALTATGERDGVRRTVRTMLAINLALGLTIAACLWMLVPFVVGHMTHYDPALYFMCLWSLRLGAPLIVIKAIESVFVSAQKAYQRYGPAVQIGLATRLLTIAVCTGLAVAGYGVVSMMAGTVVSSVFGMIAQWAVVQRHLGSALLLPEFDLAITRGLLSFGGFTWLQALSGLLFSQADRLILGATLGPSAVAYYSVSVQLAQPIHGLTAAGLHSLFPYLAAQVAGAHLMGLRRPVLTSFGVNLFCATLLTAFIACLGPKILVLWMGQSFAAQAGGLIPLVALGFGLLALNVTPHYTLMALGSVRIVTVANVLGGTLMLLAMTMLIPGHGVAGAALARLWYGSVTCLLYVPLIALLRNAPVEMIRSAQAEVRQA